MNVRHHFLFFSRYHANFRIFIETQVLEEKNENASLRCTFPSFVRMVIRLRVHPR